MNGTVGIYVSLRVPSAGVVHRVVVVGKVHGRRVGSDLALAQVLKVLGLPVVLHPIDEEEDGAEAGEL